MKQDNKQKKNNKSLLVWLCVILITIVSIGSYFIYRVNLYKDCFIDNIFINDINVSRETIDNSILKLSDVSNKTLVLRDDVEEITLSLSDFVCLNIDEQKILEIYYQTNTLRNKFCGIDDTKYYVNKEIVIDDNNLYLVLEKFINSNERTPSVNAYIDYSNPDFPIVNEEIGTTLDVDLLINYIKSYIEENCFSNNINNEFVVDISSLELYNKPEILSFMLEEESNIYNDNLSIEFDIDFYGNIERIDKDILYSWLSLDDNNKPLLNENNGFIYDYEKVFKTMVSYANKYYTYGNEFKFLSHSGEYVVIESPNFGWSLKVDDTTDIVMEQLENKTNDLIYGVFLHKGIDDKQGGLVSYVEVDIDNQHLYYYKNGNLVLDSDFVSGNYGTNDTNKGVHRLMYKTKNATLRGRNYASFVYYWMPFNSDGEGFHDATWRNKFGGEIYKGNGSHGCVNMPLDKAKELYNLIENDTIVIVY